MDFLKNFLSNIPIFDKEHWELFQDNKKLSSIFFVSFILMIILFWSIHSWFLWIFLWVFAFSNLFLLIIWKDLFFSYVSYFFKIFLFAILFLISLSRDWIEMIFAGSMVLIWNIAWLLVFYFMFYSYVKLNWEEPTIKNVFLAILMFPFRLLRWFINVVNDDSWWSYSWSSSSKSRTTKELKPTLTKEERKAIKEEKLKASLFKQRLSTKWTKPFSKIRWRLVCNCWNVWVLACTNCWKKSDRIKRKWKCSNCWSIMDRIVCLNCNNKMFLK